MGRSKVVVLQYALDGMFVAEWDSYKSIQRALGYCESAIRQCCCNKKLIAYNFIWVKAGDANALRSKIMKCADLAMELEDIENEEWKSIPGYEDLYQISSRGRVKGLDKEITSTPYACQYVPIRKSYIKKTRLNRYGYPQTSLWKNGKSHTFCVHCLVAMAFIPNPEGFPCINHKDEVKTNNNVENLEWCTVKYNSCYGTARKRSSEKCFKKVYQFTLSGKLICRHNSLKEASIKSGISMSTLSMTCNKNGIKNGYQWSYNPMY